MLVHRNTINISVKAAKQILEFAIQGGLRDTDAIGINLHENSIELKETYFTPPLEEREFIIIDGVIGERKEPHNMIAELKPK